MKKETTTYKIDEADLMKSVSLTPTPTGWQINFPKGKQLDDIIQAENKTTHHFWDSILDKTKRGTEQKEYLEKHEIIETPFQSQEISSHIHDKLTQYHKGTTIYPVMCEELFADENLRSWGKINDAIRKNTGEDIELLKGMPQWMIDGNKLKDPKDTHAIPEEYQKPDSTTIQSKTQIDYDMHKKLLELTFKNYFDDKKLHLENKILYDIIYYPDGLKPTDISIRNNSEVDNLKIKLADSIEFDTEHDFDFKIENIPFYGVLPQKYDMRYTKWGQYITLPTSDATDVELVKTYIEITADDSKKTIKEIFDLLGGAGVATLEEFKNENKSDTGIANITRYGFKNKLNPDGTTKHELYYKSHSNNTYNTPNVSNSGIILEIASYAHQDIAPALNTIQNTIIGDILKNKEDINYRFVDPAQYGFDLKGI